MIWRRVRFQSWLMSDPTVTLSHSTTTVPLNRLSERDLQFVNRQASAQKASTMQTAQAESPSIGFAN